MSKLKAFVCVKEINITPQKLHSVFDAVTLIKIKHTKIKTSLIGTYKWIRFIETAYILLNLKNSTLWEVLYSGSQNRCSANSSSDSIFELRLF